MSYAWLYIISIRALHAFLALNVSRVYFSLRRLIKRILLGYLDAQMLIFLSYNQGIYLDEYMQVTKLFHDAGPCRIEIIQINGIVSV